MIKTINMQDMRYINLLSKISRVRTNSCFRYNQSLIFIVDRRDVSKAIGEDGKNVKEMSEILGKKIKIVGMPNINNPEEVEKFILAIIHPTVFRGLEITETELIITSGGPQNKAMLLGRNKMRLMELKEVVKQYLKKDLRVIWLKPI